MPCPVAQKSTIQEVDESGKALEVVLARVGKHFARLLALYA